MFINTGGQFKGISRTAQIHFHFAQALNLELTDAF